MAPYVQMFGTVLLTMAALGLGLLLSSAHGQIAGYDLRETWRANTNPAVMIRATGVTLALMIAAVGSYVPQMEMEDIARGSISLFSAAAALLVAYVVNDRAIVRSVRNSDAIKAGNCGVALIEFATNVATATIFAARMRNPENDWMNNIMWFVLGQAFLVALVETCSRAAPAILQKAVSGSIASACVIAGIVIGSGIAIGSAIDGNFQGWGNDLLAVAQALGIWIAVLATLGVFVHVIADVRKILFDILDDRVTTGVLVGLTPILATLAFVYHHSV